MDDKGPRVREEGQSGLFLATPAVYTRARWAKTMSESKRERGSEEGTGGGARNK